MAQVYGDSLYNTDGYWLAAEEYLGGTANSVASAYISNPLFLYGYPTANSVCTANLDLVYPVFVSITGSSLVITNSSFGINSNTNLIGAKSNSASGLIIENITKELLSNIITSNTGLIIENITKGLISNILTSNTGLIKTSSNITLASNILISNTGLITSNLDKSLLSNIASLNIGDLTYFNVINLTGNQITLQSGNITLVIEFVSFPLSWKVILDTEIKYYAILDNL